MDASTHDRAYLLDRISPGALAASDRTTIFRKLAEFAVSHPEEAYAVAGGVEKLLYVITPETDEGRALETLALELAASPDDVVRRQLLY